MILILLLPAATAVGQTTGGAIRGRVIDTEGHALSGVSVTAIYRPVALSRTTISDTAGHFSLFLLPAGTYEVSARLAGYVAVTTRRIEVELGSTRTLTVKLRKSSVQESVTVTAPASMIQSGIALGTSVSESLIRDLPLVARNVDEIVTLTPDTLLLVPPDGGRLTATLNGTRSALRLFNGAEGRLALDIDALIGVATEQPQLGAEFGRTLGGVIVVATRSGSDEYDGDLHELYRAHPRQHQFGASVGGPVVPDRTFFFTSAERRSSVTAGIAGLTGIWSTHAARLLYLSDSAARQVAFVGGDSWQVRDRLWNDFVFQRTNEIADTVTFSSSRGPLTQNLRAGASYFRNRVSAGFISDELVWSKLVLSGGARLSTWKVFARSDQKTIEPRLAVSYDVNGSGRNILRAGVGRYYGGQPSSPVQDSGGPLSSTRSVPYSDVASAGYAYQVNPWFSLNGDVSHIEYRRLPFRGRARYDAASVGARARLGDRFELEGFYGWSRSWGNLQVADHPVEPQNPLCRQCFGPLDNDARHRVSVATVVKLPALFTLAGVVRYRSATPYTDYAGVDLNGDGSAFDLPPGVSHVNSLRGSRFSETDIRLAKTFSFRNDERSVELIFDVFNVFDERNAAGYRGSRADPGYGTPAFSAGDFPERPRRLAEIGVRMSF